LRAPAPGRSGRDFQLALGEGAISEQELQLKRMELLEAYEEQRIQVGSCWAAAGQLALHVARGRPPDARSPSPPQLPLLQEALQHRTALRPDASHPSLSCPAHAPPSACRPASTPCHPPPQELRAEEDRIYTEWMAAAEAAATEARRAYHERRKEQLMQVRCVGRPVVAGHAGHAPRLLASQARGPLHNFSPGGHRSASAPAAAL
jgi:hypothetical protein